MATLKIKVFKAQLRVDQRRVRVFRWDMFLLFWDMALMLAGVIINSGLLTVIAYAAGCYQVFLLLRDLEDYRKAIFRLAVIKRAKQLKKQRIG